MVMETDLSLNGHNLSGYVHYLYGSLETKTGETFFVFNGNELILIPPNIFLLNATVFFKKHTGPFPAIGLKIISDNTFFKNSTKNNSTQKININEKITSGYFFVCLRYPVFKNEKFLIMIEYRVL